MRVSDAERAEVTNALCRHLGDGRLDEDEFNERQARATAAKTQADLAPLLVDLPRLSSLQPPSRAARVRSRSVVWVVAAVVLAWSVSNAVGNIFHPHAPWALIALAVVAYLGLRRSPRQR